MTSNFDRWEKDPFFEAAEEVQESADRLESAYRTWIRSTKDDSSVWNSDELRRDLNTALGTAKWQLDEFNRAVKSSYSRSSIEDTRNRHRDFVAAIDEKITKVEYSLYESDQSGGEAPRPWAHLDEGEQDELALFLSGMPATGNPRLVDTNSVSNCSKNAHALSGLGEAKEDRLNAHRRAASASADIGSWKIAVSDDAQQWSSSSGSSGPMPKVASLSAFLSSMGSVPVLKWPRNGYRKLNHQEPDNALLPMTELKKGNKASFEKSKSCLESSDESYDKQLYGWYGAIQRQIRRSQYQMRYSQPVRITVSIVVLLCLIDPFFEAAEEVQESADRLESAYRTWIRSTKDDSSVWNSDELRRDLNTALGTAKWQLDEFNRAVKSSYSRSSIEDTRNRHRDFVAAIDEKITKVEYSLYESDQSGGEAPRPWAHLDEGEQDELALFLSGMPATGNPRLVDTNSVSNCSKNAHALSGLGEAKEDRLNAHRRAASASADIGSWKIAVSDDAQQWSSSSGSSGPMPKVSFFLDERNGAREEERRVRMSEFLHRLVIGVEVLGAGSYGTVSLAILVDEQNRFHSFIAVKSSIPRLAFSLEKEEQIFKSLWEGESGGCQEIIECFGTEITVEHGHQFYNLFLEYAPYGSLADLIHKKPLPETEVSVYARMIVKGLSHIHRKGIVHCDLKPENILVFPSLDKEIANYQLKIADFGLSKTKEEKADVELWKSKPRGTPSYLSPEAFSGHIDAPMDIWALGCIVIEMLTGLPAWGESPLLIEELRYLVEHHELSPRKPQGIGFFCHDFLEKCFTKDPSKRWTADRVLDHPFLYITHNDQQPQHSLAIPEDDLGVKRVRDLKKRKREEPVASGTLRIWNLEFIEEEDEEGEGAVEKRVWE
ncbi:hypothetical protein Ahy_A06g030851 isoform A [Arachis hypogaea]|uniref:Protein kinase domain-containing protein n=1 Tax=Arachis hypogaea TaxID=3818 RepID=A0A445CXN4_ARAHY|nr:hypothetical protein Ahy_A06g030851 isoform A [Arachis hypogaea]